MKCKITKTELAWAAGFFDGDGCFTTVYRRDRNSYQIRASIGQVDRKVLDRFRRAVGVGTVCGPYISKRGNQPMYHYRAGGSTSVATIATKLWEFLSSVKRAQYKRAHKLKESI